VYDMVGLCVVTNILPTKTEAPFAENSNGK